MKRLSVAYVLEHPGTDPVTGLHSARYFNRILREELRRAARFDLPLSVILVDMDLLSDINSSFGRSAGDLALSGTAEIIHRNVRQCDVVSRLGDEEFAVILPETEAVEALAVAERIREKVESTCFSISTSTRPIEVTVSLGIAAYPVHGADARHVLHQADQAVYHAKLCGRNRSCIATVFGAGA